VGAGVEPVERKSVRGAREDHEVISKQNGFSNRRGETLAGFLDLPCGEKVGAYAVFAHCFTCGKDLKPFDNLGRALAGRGIALLRFDFSGLGESEGDFSRSTVATNVDDVIDASEFLAANYEGPKILIGHSMEGAR